MKKKEKQNLSINDSKINGLLNNIFEEIESRSLGNTKEGISMSFFDFDAITQGLIF